MSSDDMSRWGRQRVHSRDFPIFPTPIGLAAMWSPAPRQMAEPIRPLTCAAGVHQALAPVLDVASIAFALARPRHLVINEILLRPASQLN